MTGVPSRILTIGIYGFDAATFCDALTRANVDVVVDIRARRGLRGSQYAWGNSGRLQDLLRAHRIAYVQLREFAPTEQIRDLQRATDMESATAKRDRTRLGDEFIEAYRRDVLQGDVSRRVLATLGSGMRSPALLCVERAPEACHRSLLAERLRSELAIPVEHLLP